MKNVINLGAPKFKVTAPTRINEKSILYLAETKSCTQKLDPILIPSEFQ